MSRVSLDMSVRNFKKLADYLESHEMQIAVGENDFGDLLWLFELVFGIPPKD